MLTDEQLTEIWRRRQAITPGDWKAEPTEHHSWLFDIKAKPKLAYKDKYTICETVGSEDAEFIQNAPADIEALLTEVKRLRGLVEDSAKKSDVLSSDDLYRIGKAIHDRESTEPPPVIEDQLDSGVDE